MTSKVLLIGLDGATFSVLEPLMESGVMPNLRSLLDRGTKSELASVIPPLTPPAWTSLMTGRNPGNHGIFDFLRFEFRPGGRELRVMDASDVACPTIWSIAARHGLRSTVLNFPMTFPARGFVGAVVPGWVPWRHLRMACYPRTLFEELSRSLPQFSPRELAMDMALEERALEGCHGEEDFEKLIQLHIRRERQWFDVARYLMRNDPSPLTAILFDGVDKLQHFAWRFIDQSFYPSAPDPTTARIRELCLQYYREVDEFMAEAISLSGENTSVFVASDHGFGPTVEVFHLNEWLHRNGYLVWANASNVEQKHAETLGLGTMARRFYEIDWQRTTAYCPTPSSNGIYIAPPSENGAGVPAEQYETFRKKLIHELLEFTDPKTGQSPVTRIWTREEAFGGTHMHAAPDLTLMLRDGGLVSILPSDVLVKPRSEPTGAHRPNGVFVAVGNGIRKGSTLQGLSILDVAPTLLHALGLPIPEDLEGRAPEALYETGYLQMNPVSYEKGEPKSSARDAVQARAMTAAMDADIVGHLRALGYME